MFENKIEKKKPQLLSLGDMQFFNGDKDGKRLKEINDRLSEIRGMLDDSEKRGDTKFSDLEKEVRELKEEKEEIEARQRLGDFEFGADVDKGSKEDRSLQQQAHQGGGQGEYRMNPTDEQREAFSKYLETREIDGGALKTDSGFVVIPEQVITEIMELKEKEYNLDQYVTVKNVSYGSGKYPVIRQSEVAALAEVEELAENPKLGVKPFYNLAYDIKTHRGYFLVSRETIEDAAVNVLSELMTWMARTIAATRNAAIIKAIKNGTPGEEGKTLKFENVDVTGMDGIKDEINLKLLPNYEHNVAIVSKTAFATLDKMKDKQGNYLLQPDIKEPTVKRLSGAKVEVLPDEMIGDASANTIIIGNLKDGIVLFNRSQYQAGWTNYMQFGESLMVAVRQDVRILDEKSVIVLNFTEKEVEETP